MAQRVDTKPGAPQNRPWWLALGALFLLGCPIADVTIRAARIRGLARRVGFGAWQPAATNYRAMPLGWDGTPYSYMTLDLWPTGGDSYDMGWHYFADISGAIPDLAASAYVSDLSDWVGSLVGGQWNRGLKIPLAAVGQLGNASIEQFHLRDDTNSADTYYVDNVGFVPGSYAWAYSGGAGPHLRAHGRARVLVPDCHRRWPCARRDSYGATASASSARSPRPRRSAPGAPSTA